MVTTTARPLLDVLESGSPHGTAVVLLHGVTDSWRSFRPLVDQLPRTLRVVAPSLRGHGDSDRPAHGYSPWDMAEDVAALLDVVGVERAVVLGHSMGAGVAMRLALLQPGLVRGLVLVGAAPTWRGHAEVEQLARDVARGASILTPAFVRAFQESTLARPVPASFLDEVVAESLKVPWHAWRQSFEGLVTDDVTTRLGEIDVPVVLSCGSEDGLARHAQEGLARALPDARLHVHDGHGHAVHWEDPAIAAREVVELASSRRERDARA